MNIIKSNNFIKAPFMDQKEIQNYVAMERSRQNAGIPARNTENMPACSCYKSRGIKTGYCGYSIRSGGHIVPNCESSQWY